MGIEMVNGIPMCQHTTPEDVCAGCLESLVAERDRLLAKIEPMAADILRIGDQADKIRVLQSERDRLHNVMREIIRAALRELEYLEGGDGN